MAIIEKTIQVYFCDVCNRERDPKRMLLIAKGSQFFDLQVRSETEKDTMYCECCIRRILAGCEDEDYE
jgi:hypothetical protein